MDDEAFWLRHIRHGLVLFSVGILVALVYIFAGDPLRPTASLVLAVIAIASVGVVAALPHAAIVRSPRRLLFFYTWSAFCVAFVLLVAAVDGGAGSPMALLLVLAVLYSGLAYPPLAVVAFGVGAGGGYALLAALGPETPVGDVVLLTGTVLCVGVTGAAVAESRQRSQGALLAMHRQLQESARRDALTGCLTRAAFHEAVDAELARAVRHHRSASVLMLDLDDFKAVNDTFGHLAGDQLLEAVGRVLRSVLRAGDEAGRVGGDEFAVLLAEADAVDAARTAERLLVGLAGEHVAASIGVTEAVSGDDVTDLLGRADTALYAAKGAGKAQVAVTTAANPLTRRTPGAPSPAP